MPALAASSLPRTEASRGSMSSRLTRVPGSTRSAFMSFAPFTEASRSALRAVERGDDRAPQLLLAERLLHHGPVAIRVLDAGAAIAGREHEGALLFGERVGDRVDRFAGEIH